MSIEACRKIKAALLIATIVNAEIIEIQRAGRFNTGPGGGNHEEQDTFVIDRVKDLMADSQLKGLTRLLYEQIEATLAKPEFLEAAKRVAERMEKIMFDPTVQQQEDFIFEHVTNIMGDPQLQEQVWLLVERIEGMMAGTKFQKATKRVAEWVEEMMPDPRFEQQAKGFTKGIEGSRGDSNTPEQRNGYAEQIKASMARIEAMMADPSLQEQAKVFAQQIRTTRADTDFWEQAKKIVEQIEAMIASESFAQRMDATLHSSILQKHVKQIAEDMDLIMADSKLQEQLKVISEQIQAMVGNPKLQEQVKRFANEMKMAMDDAGIVDQAKIVAMQMRATINNLDSQETKQKLADTLTKRLFSGPRRLNEETRRHESISLPTEMQGSLGKLVKTFSDRAVKALQPRRADLDKTSLGRLGHPTTSARTNPSILLRLRTFPQSVSLKSRMPLPAPAVLVPWRGRPNWKSAPKTVERGALGGTTRMKVRASAEAEEKARRQGLGAPKTGGWASGLKLLLLIFLWYLGNWYHNATNKIAIQAGGGLTGYPLTIATGYFAAGALYALFLWAAPDARPLPKITKADFKRTLPVSILAAGAHLAFVFSLSAGSLSFVQIVKAMEPAFAAVIGTIFYSGTVSVARWFCLIPIIGGVVLASVGEMSFAWKALVVASIGNICAATRGHENKKLMLTEGFKDRIGSVGNQFAVTHITSFFFCIVGALLFEGHKLGSFVKLLGSEGAGRVLLTNMIASGVWYYLYNELGTIIIARTGVVAQSVLNTAKRAFVLIGAAILLNEGLSKKKLVGSLVSIGGVFLYSIIDRLLMSKK